MKRVLSLTVVALIFSACASAPQQAPAPDAEKPAAESGQAAKADTKVYSTAAKAPEKVTLKAKPGNITFNHKAHGERMDCAVCHGQKIGAKMTPLGQSAGHKLCLDCHKPKKAGPTKCSECHKK